MPDPDLEIMRGWGQLSRPLDKGALAQSPQKIFWPFGPQFAQKIREGGRLAPPAPPLDPLLGRWAVSQECITIRTFSSPINFIPCP